MTFWRTFHSISEDVVFSIALSLNLLLLFVIIKVKVKSMQKYNILLLQCCSIDLIQVVISFVVKPVVIIHYKSVYFLSNGFLRPIGGTIEMLGIISWLISMLFCICSMPASYIFRYCTVCLNTNISKKFYVISLLVAFLSASTFGGIVWKFHYLDGQQFTYLGEVNLTWLMADDEGQVKAVSVCLRGSLCMWLSIIDAAVVSFVPYAIIIICNIKILKYFRNHQDSLSASCRRVQSDLNQILLAQAVIPIFSAFLPMTIHLLSSMTDFDLTFVSFISGILYSWIPIGNAVSVLLFVTAYRDKLKQIFLRIQPRLSQVFSFSTTGLVSS